MSEMDVNEVIAHLPQRFPFLLIDRVKELEPGKRIVALKNVSVNEPYFTGHFPHRPIMPGVLILEAMAQAAGVLVFSAMDEQAMKNQLYYYVRVDNARFKRPVVPGDQLILEASIDRAKAGIYRYNARATVDGLVTVEASLMCTMRKVGAA